MKTLLKVAILFYSLNIAGQHSIPLENNTAHQFSTLENPIVDILIKRWKQSKKYTLAILEAMPANQLEYRPTSSQMSFAQHFIHIGFINNSFIGILMDPKEYPDFESHENADFFIDRPDPVHLFQPDNLQKRNDEINKKLVTDYVSDTFDFVIASLKQLNDLSLVQGRNKIKPWHLKGHTNLDLILRGESHTSHHRAQTILYLRMNDIQPPEYSSYNRL